MSSSRFRLNAPLVIGLACLVLGAALFVVVTRDDTKPSAPATAAERSVLAATAEIAADTDVADALDQGLLKATTVAATEAPADALAPDQARAGQKLGTSMVSGQVLTASLLRTPSLRTGVVDIPDGMRGVAVEVGFVPGIAGYAAAGDRVDVYVTLRGTEASPLVSPSTHQLLANVEVLDVSQQIAPLGDAATEGGVRGVGQPLVYLLAVTPRQAEALIFSSRVSDVYLALAGEGAAVESTPGFSGADLGTGPLVGPAGAG